MAKHYFASWFWRAKHWAGGMFAGVGADAAGSTGWFAARPRRREIVWRRQRSDVVWTQPRSRNREVVWKAVAR